MKIKYLAYTALSTSILFLSSHNAYAAGFYIQEQSVKGLGSAFSGSVSSLEDASTVYFNPAGMTKLDRAQINAGINLLIPDASFKNTGSTFDFNGGAPGGVGPMTGANSGNPYSPTPIPNFYAVTPVYNNVWAGIGISAPFGLGSEYDDGYFARYDSTDTSLKTINIQPSLAYKATDWLSVGGGIDVQYADANLKSNASNVVSEGLSTLKGDDWSLGYNIGLQIKPVESTEIGLHYRSGVSHVLDGRVSLEGLSAGNFDIPGTAKLNLPDITTLGITHSVTDKLSLSAQGTWFGWDNFEEIRALNSAGGTVSTVVQGYENTFAIAVGGEYDLNDTWTVRAGYQFDQTPTTDQYRTTRTPDGDRNWFTGGATYKLNDHIDLDFAAAYIDVGAEKINVTRNSGLANIKGNTEGNVKIISVGLNYKF